MSSYNELIKNFEKIRAYMRDFYVYGFKSRDDFRAKSSRSYDDERRRMESWLQGHMSFVRTPEGKNVFISIDSRTIRHNPLYNAWKAKSFTDGDITLHFILFDILYDPSVRKTVSEILAKIDEAYLADFESPLMFDESTVRKKLREYCEAGLLTVEKEGRKVYYRRTESTDVSDLTDILHFYSEVAPCGVIGSFLLDKEMADTDAFTFKHHYITGAIDSGVMAALFTAMRESEALGLTWDCVNLENSTITINKQLQTIRGGNGECRLAPTKNNKSRTVSIPPFVVDVLQKVKLQQEQNRQQYSAICDNSGFVFTNELGGHLKAITVYKNFKKVMVQLGYDNVRFHDLRHSYAVASIKSGDDIKTVQENLGHATASFTLDVYGHVTDQMKQASAARMEQFIRSVNQ